MATSSRRTKSAAPPPGTSSSNVKSSGTPMTWIDMLEDDGKPTTLLWRLADAVYFYLRSTYPDFQGIDAPAFGWLLNVAALESELKIATRVQNFTRYLNDIGVEYKVIHRERRQFPALGRRAWVTLLTWETRAVPIYSYKFWKRLIARLPLQDPQTRRPFPSHPPRTSFPSHGDKSLRGAAASFASLLEEVDQTEATTSRHQAEASSSRNAAASTSRPSQPRPDGRQARSAQRGERARNGRSSSRHRSRRQDPFADSATADDAPAGRQAATPQPITRRSALPTRDESSRHTVAAEGRLPEFMGVRPTRRAPPPPPPIPSSSTQTLPRTSNRERERGPLPPTLRPPLPQRAANARHTIAVDDTPHVRRVPPPPPPPPPPVLIHRLPPPPPPPVAIHRVPPQHAPRTPIPVIAAIDTDVPVPSPDHRLRAVASQPMLSPTVIPPTPIEALLAPPTPVSPLNRRSASFPDERVAYNPFVQLMAGQRSPDGEMVPSFESLSLDNHRSASSHI
ncbi:hypothetical protein EXIGLDRAFT_87566 [Exidia glandulosa HHB12029]|uniref:DUF7514 domain-containing protein n=1 Tax=Exidia glandulosa HHB12029 TaxID=1314781 RepID=A0A165NST7_EXIGL|nr:hypothetical protein EXIGLDRAFT_87566 [Exidia glandulosa HHB12029]